MIRVQTKDFDVGRELSSLTEHNVSIGGIVTFVGTVRGNAEGNDVGAMTLEHYPGMTHKELEKIENTARERWNLAGSLIIHRHGRLKPGDRIVLVITASAHRRDAFEACEFLVDWLKTKAPFWKLEETSDGTRWVASRATDDAASSRWTE
tara:strand:+ start:38 stop:487 length:450 start_codon:yes stop_codon:yes gene_type:complete